MSTIVTRAGKGSPLTNNEVDSNFTNLNTDKVESITSADGSVVVSTSGTTRDLSVGVAGSTATLISQVRNETGATLTKGTVVYISGAAGNKAVVSKAIATGDSTSAQTYGMIQADIPHNQNGYVVVIGAVSGLNTSAFTDGTQLYLSGVSAGGYTNTKPYAPTHLVYVGIVTYSHATQGTIQVKIQNGYELDEIHDVSARTPVDGQTLVYVSSTGLWTKTDQSAMSVGSAATLATARNINGVSFNGSADITVADTTKLPLTGGTLTGKLTLDGRNEIYGVPTNAGTVAGFMAGTSGGTTAARTQSLNTQTLLKIEALGYTGSGWTGGAGLSFVATENITATNRGTKAVLSAITAGSDTATTLEWDGSALTLNGSTAVTSSNYNNYAPTKTGTGASGTWGINISGSAASATNASQLNGKSSWAYSGPDSVVRQYFWDTLSAAGSQARTFEIARLGIDYNDWNGGSGPFEVELYEKYYSRGLKKKYVIHWGYTNTYGIQLVEYSGSGDNNFQVRIGSPVQVSGDNYYLPVFVDVRYYGQVDVRVTTNRTPTASNPPGVGSTYINASPSPTNISDFSADSTVSFSSVTTVQVAGNQLLHAGNYSSYALPLSGGTVNGAVRINGLLQVGQNTNGTAYIDAYGGFAWFGRDSNSAGIRIDSSGNVHTTGTLNSVGTITQNANQVLHASNYSSYALPLSGGTLAGSLLTTTAASSWGVYSNTNGSNYSGIWFSTNVGELLLRKADGSLSTRIAADGSFAFINNNNILHAGNYSSYAYPAYTQPGGVATPTGGLNGASQGWAALDGYGTAVPNYGGSDYWVGVWTGGNSSRGIQIAGGYSDVDLYFRKGADGWSPWRRVLNSSNYSSYALPLSGGTVLGRVTFQDSSDTQITLNGNGTNWTGITATDAGGTDYLWIYGATGTWSFGGGGSVVSGKKMHIHGGVTIGSGYTATSNPSNGLNVEGAIQQAGNQVLHAGNSSSYKSRSLNSVRTTNVNFNALNTDVDTFTAGTNYIPSGGAYNQPVDGDHHYLSWGGIEGSNVWGAQLDINFYDDRMWFRRQNASTWQSWRNVLHDGNFSSYALPLSGGTLSGSIYLANDSANGIFNAAGNAGYRPDDAYGNTYMFNTAGAGGWYGDFSGYYFRSSGSSNWMTISGSAVNSLVALQQSGNQVLHAGNYTSYSPSLGGSGASGTWGISISGSAAQLGGYGPNQTGGVNTIVQRDSNGYIQNSYFYTSGGGSERNGSGLGYFTGYNSSDYYIRSYTPAAAASAMGALTTSNYSSYALPLSGGTLTGTLRTPTNTGIIIGSGVTTSDALRINFHTEGDLSYYIGKRAGVWTQPLDIAFYTGIRYHAHNAYGGHRWYTTGVDSNLSFSVGDGDNNVRVANTLFINGNTALHAGNYNSYALPFSGGTLSGTLSFQQPVGLSFANGQYIKDNNGGGLAIYSGAALNLNSTTLTVSGAAIRQGNNLARPLASWGSSGATGMVIFKLPGSSGNYGMLHMVFDIYEYNSNSVSTVIVGGHNWASNWYNTGANVVGQLGKQVRLGYKDGQYCVVFGDSSSYWEYGQIVLRKIQNGAYYDNIMDLGAAIDVSFTSTESFSNIGGDLRALRTPASFNAGGAITQSGNQVLHAGNYTSYSPSLGGSGASGTWGISITGNAGSLQGYQWGSAGKDIRGSDIYADNWLRNYNSGTGLYNQATGNHWYSDGQYWNVGYGGTTGIRLRNGHAGTVLGYLYAETSGNFGLLHSNAGWAVQVYPGGSGYLHGTWNGGNIRANRANGNFYIDDNYGCGIVGAYASTRYQGVFFMGDSYKMSADGTSLANMYGIGWSHPNAGGAAGNLTDHGMLIINNGGFRCAISNSIVASGNVTAYSDERLKTNWRDMPENFVARLAQVKVGIYDRTDEVELMTQVGVSAQSFQKLLPEAILTAKDEMQTLSVSYGNAALASAVELAKDNVELRARIERLESLINKLIGD